MTEIRGQHSGANMQIANGKWRMVKPISDLRLLISGLCALFLALSVSAQAQQPKKVLLLGYLSNSNPASESTRSEIIREALRERGFLDGKNIAIEYRYAEGKID